MENNNEKSEFRYTYSAKEREELKKIREKYTHKDPPEESKMERLRRLDRSVTKKAQTVSLVFGIIGTLILGFGMSLAMSELAAIFGEYAYLALPVGITVGVIGGILVCLAYPVYNWVSRHERKRIAHEVLRLTEELLG